MSELKVDTISANTSSSITMSNQVRMTSGAVVTGSATLTGGITAGGKVESLTELESVSLDINGDGDVSGNFTCGTMTCDGSVNANTVYVQGVQIQPHIVAFAKFNGSALISAKNVEGYTDNGSGSITFDFSTAVEDNAYVVLASTNDATNTIEIGTQATDSVTLENVPAAGCSFLVLDVLVDELIDNLTPPVVELDDLTDVTVNTPLGKQVLQYTGNVWRNASLDASDVGTGTFADSRISSTSVKQHLNNAYTGQIETAADKTYTIDPAAAAARTISGFYIKSGSGTCTATLKVGTNTVVAASVSTTSGDQTGLSNTSVTANDAVTIVVSSNSSATDVIFSVEYTE